MEVELQEINVSADRPLLDQKSNEHEVSVVLCILLERRIF